MKKLAQVQVQLVFADVSDDGEIGDMSQPVQLTVSGKDWNANWSTPRSREVVANVQAQLAAQSNGKAPAPAPKKPRAAKK